MGVVRPTAPESLPLAVAAIRSSISAGVVVEDRDGNVAIANAAAQRLLGPYVATSPGWRATPGWELTDADGGALTHEALAPSLARARKEAVREQLIVVRAPSGEQAWLTLDAEPVLNEHGQLEGVVITITDRTGVMQVVRELSANHAELRHVVDAGHDGYFIRDFATGTTVHSARMNALVGLPPVDTQVGLDEWRQRIHPDDAAGVAGAVVVAVMVPSAPGQPVPSSSPPITTVPSRCQISGHMPGIPGTSTALGESGEGVISVSL